ncbi:MAG: murein L,D-transpeptidase [Prosthecochloris sp.]|nr:murein L,D-transpeptidase [Prosthecochloris sp.]
MFVMIALLVVLLAFGPGSTQTPPVQKRTVAASSVTEVKRKSGKNHEIRENIRCHIEQLENDQALRKGRERMAFNAYLADFYRSNDFSPVWVKRSQISEMLDAIKSVEADGLLSQDYHLSAIQEFYENSPDTPFLKARYELLLTDAMFKLSYHLLHGKVDPEKLDSNWNLSEGVNGDGLAGMLRNALAGDSLAASIAQLRPKHPSYSSLKEGLARYRRLAADGGWGTVPEGPTIKEIGQYDARIPALRGRLEISGEIEQLSKVDTSYADEAMRYSVGLQEAVKKFQNRHGLQEDGEVGPKTLRALNVPVEKRVEQIRINLERYRWFVQKLEPTYLLVNIAGFNITYFEQGAFKWGSRVIVGEPFWKTPVFKAQMQYVIFNPSWNVPPGILRKEALPAIRKDPGYLSRHGLQVVDRNGNVVNPGSVNWASGAQSYRLRQPPGSRNALGRVKFMFPNKHLVYLHDTPGKHLFDKSSRAFSHGCIRLQNPLDLAELLLGWSGEKVRQTVSAGRTRRINLPTKLPVFLLYLTAVAEGEEVQFKNDVYSRDAAVLQALNSPFPYKTVESCTF